MTGMEHSSNFAVELVRMAKAVEELPQVQAEVERLKAELDHARQTVQDRELSLLSLREELERAHQATNKAEVDRDEAVRAFLEADDRTEKALAFVRTVMGNAQGLMAAIETPKAEPVPTSAPASEGSATNTDVVSGTVPQEAGSSGGMGEPGESKTVPVTTESSSVFDGPGVSGGVSSAAPSEGQREPDPTHPSAVESSSGNVSIGSSMPQPEAKEANPSDPLAAPRTGTQSEPVSSGYASERAAATLAASPQDDEPTMRYSPEWYQWADRTGYWNKRQA